MVKRTQTIRGQQPTNCLSVFSHFVVLKLKGLTVITTEVLQGLIMSLGIYLWNSDRNMYVHGLLL